MRPDAQDGKCIFRDEQPLSGSNSSGNKIAGYAGSMVSAGTGFSMNSLANNLSQDRIAQKTISGSLVSAGTFSWDIGIANNLAQV